MTTYPLRAAIAEDFPAIKDLVRNARINPLGLKWSRFIVVENDLGDVIGCAQVKPHRDGSYELASLVVAPNFQGHGIARSLVDHFIQQHEGDLHLMCRSSLGDFYQKLGFEPLNESQMPPYFRMINCLASLAEILLKENETLLVMRNAKSVVDDFHSAAGT